MTRAALVAYSFGLTGIVLIKVLAPSFYARQNIKTPVKIAIFTLCVTQLFNVAFVPFLQHAGLALATGLGACVNAGLLFFFIRKHKFYQPQPEWMVFFFKVGVALYFMAGALWWLMGTETSWLTMSPWLRGLKLAGLVGAGVIVYFISLWMMGFRLRDFSKRVA
jgi:putative peptidoglycan lipid II flippase